MKVRNMALCALFAALLCVCAWVSVPVGDAAITMQTFGIFLALGVLGGKRGSISVAIYLLLGIVGLPVFSGCTVRSSLTVYWQANRFSPLTITVHLPHFP